MAQLFNVSMTLPEESRKHIERRKSGERLEAIYSLPGWQDVISILQEEIDAAEKKLRAYRDSDAQQTLRLLSELQGKQDALKHLLDKVKSRIALTEDRVFPVSAYDTL